MKLQYRLTIFISIIILIVIGGIGVVTYYQVQNSVETQMGNNAMDLAVTIASIDKIEETLATSKDYETVQKTIESFRDKTRFKYVIVMDMNGVKYSYPYGNSLGKKYADGGEKRVLTNGESYIAKDKNVLITSIRAFVPIYYNGTQVGAVLVGLLTDTVYSEINIHLFYLKIALIGALLLGIVGAAILANIIKKSIFGLEPKEIALLLGQQDVILQNLKNGILAIDSYGKIILLNKTAKNILNLEDQDQGKNVEELIVKYTDQMMEVLINKKAVHNQEIKISDNKTLMCSHTLLKNYKEEIIGVVSSFQDLTEVKSMAEELTGIKKMTSDLRSQNHEFLNKLHTISGLVQLEEYEEAVEYISHISKLRGEISDILSKRIKNVHIAGLLLGKYNKATEANISVEIDTNSYVKEIPGNITVDEICSVIGNLIENSIEELVKIEEGKIFIRLNSNNESLRIRIQDNGPGISDNIIDKIFVRGFTTKEGNRGLGLSIIKQIIDYAGGDINILQDNGTIWDIYIPMKRGRKYD
ncbi:ATP-binding protein [Clostridium lacusfryxellense]|uniref:ATP-binding protein n=1 Tax=Clostridium lacusfryxellense TaxID=205328 RepID=UPI001C0C8D18|nr:sensor histidine kinase [Clostridium lacusfryxellense]MBU3114203.1 sensor histidine kinase [Clostridium lacusfryxellense]